MSLYVVVIEHAFRVVQPVEVVCRGSTLRILALVRARSIDQDKHTKAITLVFSSFDPLLQLETSSPICTLMLA
jgi:hypothetical protein